MGAYVIGQDPNQASEITGSGTANYIAKFTGGQAIGNSSVLDDGTYVSVGATDRMSFRVSDGRLVAGIAQGSLGSGFSHSFASTTSGAGNYAFTVSTSGFSAGLFLIYNNGAFDMGYLSGPVTQFSGNGSNTYTFTGSTNQKVGINTTPTALLDVVGDTEQFRLRYAAGTYTSFTVAALGGLTVTNSAATSGSNIAFNFSPPANTGQTASTEIQSFKMTGASREWATGAITIQRENYFSTVTYTAVGASTIAQAYGLYIEAPTASTNITITNNFALGLSNGSYTAKFGQYTGVSTAFALYTNQATPSGSNYTLLDDGSSIYLNGKSSNSVYIQIAASNVARFGPSFQTHTPGVAASGAVTAFTITQPANTGQTASTEIPGFKFTGGSRQWATGGITTQRETYFSTTTYTAVGASVITDAYGMYVEAPTASTNITITNKWGLGVTSALKVSSGASGAAIFTTVGAGITAVLESNTTNYLNFMAPDANVSGFVFGAPSDSFGALIRWGYTAAVMDIGTAATGHSINFLAGNSNTVANFATSNLSFSPIAGSIGVTPTFLFTQPAQTGATNATECVGFKFTGGSKAWAAGGGTLATQRETYLSTTTYTAATNAMTITNAYSAYIEAPTASTNITITNNYALGLSGSLRMVTGRILGNQGADVASANNLALGTDGNSFEITGATQINLISNISWQNGSEITLLFTSTPTVKHNQATSGTDITIQLAGAADFVASAGDTLTLLLSEIGGTQAWREISRAVI